MKLSKITSVFSLPLLLCFACHDMDYEKAEAVKSHVNGVDSLVSVRNRDGKKTSVTDKTGINIITSLIDGTTDVYTPGS